MTLSEEFLESVDGLIKAGNYVQARKALDKIIVSKVSERLIIRTSDLFIRTGLFTKNIRLLYKSMYSQTQIPTTKIVAHYALSLQQIGAHFESTRIFESLDFSKAPEAHFYYAITLFAKWEYDQAIFHLEKYLASPELSPYQQLVAKSNLAQAYLENNDIKKAKGCIEEVEKQAKGSHYELLRANIYQRRAQLLYLENNFKEAFKYIDLAEKLLKNFANHYQLTPLLWRAVCTLAENRQSREAQKMFEDLRKQSIALQRWALVRYSDFYQSIITKDEQLFLKVYFGTPFRAYRQNLIKKFQQKIEIPRNYDWNPTGKKAKEGSVLDVKEGLDLKSGNALKRGQRIHRLLQTLTSDFYVNFKNETIASYLFPNEHYDPYSSFKRAYESVRALQKWLKESKVPIIVRPSEEGFRIFFETPYVLRVETAYDENAAFTTSSELEKALSGNRSYTAEEISKILKIPLRTTYRKINDLLSNNSLLRQKTGRIVKYRLKTRQE